MIFANFLDLIPNGFVWNDNDRTLHNFFAETFRHFLSFNYDIAD